MNSTNQGFKAFLFHPDLGNEVVEGTLSVDRWGVHFRSPVVSEDVGLDLVQLELEEGSGRIYLNNSSKPELRIYTLDQSILNDRAFVQCNPLRSQVSAIATRNELMRRLRVVGYFAAGCVLLFWLGSLGTSMAIRALVARVPAEWEERFGSEAIRELRESNRLVSDSNQVARLTEMAAPLLRVVPGTKEEIKIYIARDEEPNAFALPGGHVVINTGLLEMAETPEEVLGVLAHELAHVSEKHIARHLISSAGPLVIFGVLFHSNEGLLNLLSLGSAIMVVQGFSQEYETEADDVGWNYLVQANINPRGMIRIFEKFKAHEAGMEVEDIVPNAFRSHPALDKRIARLERKWRRLPSDVRFLQLTNTAILRGVTSPSASR